MRATGTDAWRLLSLVSAVGTVLLVRGPIRDPDVFWHTLVGQYTLDGHRFPHPDPWSFTLAGAHWHSTAWLSEALLAATYDISGLAGLIALRLLLLAGLLAGLYRLLVRGRPGWAGPVVFTVVALPLSSYVQERPQTASLIFCCWLAAVARNLLLEARVPSRWGFVVLTWLWAMIHGLFVLAPTCLVLLALGQLLDGGTEGRRRARWLATTAGLAALAAAATPMGPRLLLAPVTVASAAQNFIAEWAPTRLTTFSSWGFAGVAALLLISWSRSEVRVSRSQLLWLLALSAFAFTATRNAAPVAILLAPLAAPALSAAWNTTSTITVARRVVTMCGAAGGIVAVASYATAPVLAPSEPLRIARMLGEQPGVVRVLDDYNVSGFLLREAWPHVRVAVDGRADRYGEKELARYSEAVNGGPGWQKYVRSLHADAALLRRESALTQLLRGVEHWQVVTKEGPWLLLAPPGSELLRTSAP